MVLKFLSCLLLAAVLSATSETHCYGRPCYGPMGPPFAPGHITDLTTLITLAKALNQPTNNQPNGVKMDELVMKLVNALIYTSMHNNKQGGKGGDGGTGGTGGKGGSEKGLLIALLNSLLGSGGKKNPALIDLVIAKDGNLLGLDLSGQPVLDVGLGSVGEKPDGEKGGQGVVGGLLSGLL